MTTIRLLIVDDTAVGAQSVAAALAIDPALRIVAATAMASDTVALIEDVRPDVVILVTALPEADLDALIRVDTLIRMIRRRAGDGKILLVASTLSEEDQIQMLTAGVDGCLPASASSAQICHAVRAVMSGESWVTRSVIGVMFDQLVWYHRHTGPAVSAP